MPTFTSRNNWSTTTINNYLRMSSVIGHFQAHNVSMIDGKKTYTKTGNLLKDYYPAIVSEDLFYRVQASFKKSTHGRKGNFTNLFRGLIICDKCNGTMSWASSPILTGGHHTYLRCRNFSIHRTCDKESVKYEPFEKHIIETLKHIDLSIYIQGNVDYRLEIQTKNNVVKNLEKQLTNYQLAIGESSPDAISGLIAQLEKVQGQIHDVHISIAELKSKTKETTGIKLKEAAHRLDTSSYISRKEFNNILSSYIEQVNPSNDHYTIKFIERDVPLTVIIAENREI
ncbi:MAG: recombinase zinc beta ribbon domain-containing protein, partial [Pseudoalteromonas sp.]